MGPNVPMDMTWERLGPALSTKKYLPDTGSSKSDWAGYWWLSWCTVAPAAFWKSLLGHPVHINIFTYFHHFINILFVGSCVFSYLSFWDFLRNTNKNTNTKMSQTSRLSRALITFKTLSKTWNDSTTHHQLFQKQIKIAIFLEFNFFQLDIGVVQVEFTHSNKTNIVRIMEAAGARSSRLRIIKEQREEYLEYIFRRIWQPLRLERRFSFCQEGEKSHFIERVFFVFVSWKLVRRR